MIDRDSFIIVGHLKGGGERVLEGPYGSVGFALRRQRSICAREASDRQSEYTAFSVRRVKK